MSLESKKLLKHKGKKKKKEKIKAKIKKMYGTLVV